jgi:hypothetical protein
MTSKLRIIVTGLVGLYPVGGVAWDYLQYVIGLAKLGHDVYYYEDTWRWPYHPLEKQYTADGSYSAKYIGDFFKDYAPELKDKWHYFHLHETSFGIDRVAFNEVAKQADLFLNISGACAIPEQLSPQCIKVFLDTDPGYNQIVFSERFSWSENVGRWCQNVAEHDRHFTYAENIHNNDCLIPSIGFNWKTTRMPIVRGLWDLPPISLKGSKPAPWTTVMSWNAFKGKLIYQEVEYKSKGAEFEKFMSLPKRIKVPFFIAVGGITTPFKWFEKHDWRLVSRFLSERARQRKFKQLGSYGWQVGEAPNLTSSPQQYCELIANSRGELSVAKNVYVALHTGWFSCRSACYLAAGKPVVVQDTGFSSILPTGAGIMPFLTLEEAVAAIETVEGDYERHAKAARVIAEEYFDSDKVLNQFIEEAFSCNG